MNTGWRLSQALAALLLLGTATVAQATGTWETVLQPRDIDADGVVDAWYDSHRGVTWAAEVGAWGEHTWAEAQATAGSAQVAGLGGWRLPRISGNPDCPAYTYDGSGDCGYNVNADRSEMAYYFERLLGNKPYYDTGGNGPQPGWGVLQAGPFLGLADREYWTGTTSGTPAVTDYAWLYNAYWGYQDQGELSERMGLILLRDGDVALVPEPATWAMWLAALGAGVLRWRRPAGVAAIGLLAAGLGGVAPAVAAPVAWDSTYSVLVRARAEDSSRVGGIRFDGLAERFTHTVTLADGSRSDVAVDVTESQTDLGDGRWRIEIGFDADADLFPTGAFAGFAFGSGIDDPLDLTGDWELLSLEQAIYVGGVLRQSYEWLPYIESVGQASPWGGYSLEPGRFGAFPAEVGVGAGVDGLRFTVLLGPVAAVPLPSSGALAGVALVLGALAARPRPARRPGGRGGARARRPLALVKAVGLAGAIGLAGVAAAAPVTVFSGVDAGVGPLDPRPVSTAAAGSFDAAATATGAALQRLDFEGFGLVAIGDGLDLGAGVRVSGEHIRPGIGVRSSPFAGAFNTTGGGTRYLAFMTDAVEPGATIVSTLNFSFDRPIDAFGAMVSGSNADQTLMVSFDDGDAHEFVVPPGGSGVAFFGLRSDGGSFSSITFTQTWTNTYAVDLVYSVGLDDLAFTHAVPLPDSAALAALGLGLASAAARRRRR